MDERADADELRVAEAPTKQTWREIARQWPVRTLLILTTEFCERYSFFGMRTFFNSFAVLCYTTPILGSIIADGYIGKFRTILAVSVVYACGHVLLAISATRASGSSEHPWLDITALVVIAFGTGGIKPCVASFGLSCFGQDSCYPVAFGIPVLLMVISMIIFALGSVSYNKTPPKDNVFGEVFRLMSALDDQQGSVWVVQATQMDSRLWGTFQLSPDQLQALNTVLLFAFIPFFQFVVYPMLSKVVNVTPLRKMVAGGVTTALSFAVAGLVQARINTTLPELPSSHRAFISVVNGLSDCSVNVSLVAPGGQYRIVAAGQSLTDDKSHGLRQLFDVPGGLATWQIAYSGFGCTQSRLLLPQQVTYNVTGGTIGYIYVGTMGAYFAKADPTKPMEGNGEFALAYTPPALPLRISHADKRRDEQRQLFREPGAVP